MLCYGLSGRNPQTSPGRLAMGVICFFAPCLANRLLRVSFLQGFKGFNRVLWVVLKGLIFRGSSGKSLLAKALKHLTVRLSFAGLLKV